MKGQIYKIHSDFYYVNFNGEIYECKMREVLKKQKIKLLVGDFVECNEVNDQKKTAVIEKVLPRKNFLTRPSVANVEQVVIISAVKEPDLDFEQLNRYICFANYHGIDAKLCFNKNDLSDDDNLIEKVFKIYEPLGFEIVFTSALEKVGIDDFLEVLGSKVTAFAGNSGVGKSTLINTISPGLNLRTKEVSEKTSRGTHTTRHCEIIELSWQAENQDSELLSSTPIMLKIIDTPGFSHVKFDFLMPNEVDELFPEIVKFKGQCKFKDCLHIHEDGCAVLENMDNIEETRYQSYLAFVEESKEYKEKIKYQGTKTESFLKENLNKSVAKISHQKRQSARNTQRQNVYKELDEDE